MQNIELVRFQEKYINRIWEIGFSEEYPEWAKWNGPYFEEYLPYQDVEEFKESPDWTYLLKDNCRCILVDGTPIGMVSRNWHDEKTRWLEIGIVIYDESYWHNTIGTRALELWTDITFEDFAQIEHIGLTTWSGNTRMMRSAEKLGFLKEAQIRKVRYWQGVYYDSVKYGVLREEWQNKFSSQK